MKVKHLIEALKNEPEDMEIVLSKFFAINTKDKEDGDLYECIMDFPIVGLAANPDDNEIRLVVDGDDEVKPYLSHYGEVKLFEEGS